MSCISMNLITKLPFAVFVKGPKKWELKVFDGCICSIIAHPASDGLCYSYRDDGGNLDHFLPLILLSWLEFSLSWSTNIVTKMMMSLTVPLLTSQEHILMLRMYLHIRNLDWHSILPPCLASVVFMIARIYWLPESIT